jgi:hypothetical protein
VFSDKIHTTIEFIKRQQQEERQIAGIKEIV